MMAERLTARSKAPRSLLPSQHAFYDAYFAPCIVPCVAERLHSCDGNMLIRWIVSLMDGMQNWWGEKSEKQLQKYFTRPIARTVVFLWLMLFFLKPNSFFRWLWTFWNRGKFNWMVQFIWEWHFTVTRECKLDLFSEFPPPFPLRPSPAWQTENEQTKLQASKTGKGDNATISMNCWQSQFFLRHWRPQYPDFHLIKTFQFHFAPLTLPSPDQTLHSKVRKNLAPPFREKLN